MMSLELLGDLDRISSDVLKYVVLTTSPPLLYVPLTTP